MKKVIFGILVSAIASSALAADAGAPITTGTAIDTTAATGCSLLSEQVTVNLSTGVFGAYACNTVANVIGVATCHPNGRKGDVAVDCDPVAVAADPDNGIAGNVPPAGCAMKPAPNVNPNNGTVNVRGGLAYTASSQGGRVGGANAVNCNAGGNTTAEARTAARL